MRKTYYIIQFNTNHSRYEAFGEDGKMIAYSHLSARTLALTVDDNKDYEQVFLNSRCGRTILDKINQHSL